MCIRTSAFRRLRDGRSPVPRDLRLPDELPSSYSSSSSSCSSSTSSSSSPSSSSSESSSEAGSGSYYNTSSQHALHERKNHPRTAKILYALFSSTSFSAPPSSHMTIRSQTSPPPKRLSRFCGLDESMTCTCSFSLKSLNQSGRSRMAPMFIRIRVCSYE